MTLAAGSTLKDTFVLEQELGQGGMGVVWVARHRVLDSRVAVKVLHALCADEARARARFEQEARAIARVDSPHVVRIFDSGITEEGEPFFVMELLTGSDLREAIRGRGALGCADAVRVVRQACAALGRAHELGIIHRDIKPGNIFLVSGSDELFVKLLDFGVAKIADHDLGMTHTHAMVGTPYYMSPEQFVDARTLDHRSDLWSIAVVAYACVVGKLPFLGETIGALSLAVHRGTFALPSSVDDALPLALDAWFQRALDPDPAGRFQSARELAESFAVAALDPDASADAYADASRDAPATRREVPSAKKETGRSAGEPVVTELGPPMPAAATAAPTKVTVDAGPVLRREVSTASQESTASPATASPAPGQRRGGAVVIGAVTAAALFAGLSVGLLLSRGGGSSAVVPSASPQSAAATSLAGSVDAAPSASPAPSAAADPSASDATAPSAITSASASAAPSARPAVVASPVPPVGGPLPPASASNLAPGARCGAATQCATGFCVDGVCCKTACSQECMACTDRKIFGRGSRGGMCGYIEGGLDPDNECPGKRVCSGLGFCADPDKLPQW